MNIYEEFAFLINEYKLKYIFQEFNLGGNFIAQEYSFYNFLQFSLRIMQRLTAA